VETLVLIGKRNGLFGYLVNPFLEKPPNLDKAKIEAIKKCNASEKKLWKCGAVHANDAHTNYLGIQFPTSPKFCLNKALWKVAENLEDLFENHETEDMEITEEDKRNVENIHYDVNDRTTVETINSDHIDESNTNSFSDTHPLPPSKPLKNKAYKCTVALKLNDHVVLTHEKEMEIPKRVVRTEIAPKPIDDESSEEPSSQGLSEGEESEEEANSVEQHPHSEAKFRGFVDNMRHHHNIHKLRSKYKDEVNEWHQNENLSS